MDHTLDNCLISLGRTRVPGGPAFLRLDPRTRDVHVLSLPASLPRVTLATGVAANDSYIYLVAQAPDKVEPYFYKGSYFLLVLGQSDLSLAGLYPLAGYLDVHSICSDGNELYVVSSGTDEVVRLELKGPEVIRSEVHWRPEPDVAREDMYHLNSIILWKGDLLVSGFGRRSGALWSSAENGFVYNITRRETLLDGLFHPHAITPMGNDLLVCESRRQRIRGLGGVVTEPLGGYTRGLCAAGGHLLVGVSRGRLRSRSTGLLDSWGSPGGTGGRCGICMLNPETFAFEAFIDLSSYGDEVHELLAVSGAANWPVRGETEWRDACISGIDLALERIRLDHEQTCEGYQRELASLQREMQTKIEKANEIIAAVRKTADEFGAWASETAEQVKERDAEIRTLQRLLEEQTAWARAAVKQVENRDSTIRELQAQLNPSLP